MKYNLHLTLGLMLILLFSCTKNQDGTKNHADGNFVTVNGNKIWYESQGQGESLRRIDGGPGYSQTYFPPHMSEVSKLFKVIYFDAYGCGKSDRSDDPSDYAFTLDVEVVEGLRRILELGKIHLLGHSYGGLVAQAYALKFPQHLQSLVLSNTLHSGEMWQANDDNCNHEIRNQFPEVWDQVQDLRENGAISSSPEHMAVYSAPLELLYFYDPDDVKKLDAGEDPFNPEVYYAIVGEDADFTIGGEMAKIDFRIRLKEITAPTLIITGRYDRVALPSFAIQYKKYMPQATFTIMENCGHFPFIEKPNEYFSMITEFMQSSHN